MKALLTLVMCCCISLASAQSALEQMIVANANWHKVGAYTNALNEPLSISGEKELIQTHLHFVVDYLSQQTLLLNESQRAKRNLCINILKAYAHTGNFPINTHHHTRTPYFIDDYGTYCAVGYLLQQTGFDSIAQRIHTEMNYAYIKQIPETYIANWATEYGFTVDELALIQPHYGPILTCFDDTFFVAKNTVSKCPMLKNDWIKVQDGCWSTWKPQVIQFIDPIHGSAQITYTPADTFISYTPDANFIGYDSMKYIVVFGDTLGSFCFGRKDTATVIFNVLDQNAELVSFIPGDANYDGILDGVDILEIIKDFGETGATRQYVDECMYTYNVPWQNGPLDNDACASDVNNDGLINVLDLQLSSCAFPPFFHYPIYDNIYKIKVLPYDTVITAGKAASFKFVLLDTANNVVPIRGITLNMQNFNVGVPNWYYHNARCYTEVLSGQTLLGTSNYVQYPDPYESYNRVFTWCAVANAQGQIIPIDTFAVTTDFFEADSILSNGYIIFNIRDMKLLTVFDEVIDDYLGASVVFRKALTTSIDKNIEGVEASIFPNPSSSSITVTLSQQPQPGTVMHIYNAIGALVKQEDLTTSIQQINVAELADGIYTYAITQQGVRQAAGKLVVSH